MKLTKLATFLLAAMVALSPLQTVAAPQTKKVATVQKVQKKVVKSPKKKAVTSTKKSAKKTTNETQKLYGVKGATLSHVKVSNSKSSYREKGATHKVIGKEASKQYSQVGVASYYGGMFHGRKTANGEIFNKNAYTAAHKTLALGSYALVTNLRNGKKVIVRINDRGPFSKNRIIDLSKGAAKEIGMIQSGTARVRVEAMQVDSQGYIIGKGAEALYHLAKREGLNLKVKKSGNSLAIKAEPATVANKSNEISAVSQPKFAVKVLQLKTEKEAKKVANAVKAKSYVVAKGKGFDVVFDVTSASESAKVKKQLNRLGYSVLSYSEK
ncbi:MULTISPECIES: septal ring lytic transglycosylase RlpA family protein [Glaesserella]|uniref:Endolytic peptidoglycan transglycosylase RlpA n=1 Tax=Glaesserella australis TaxID=2094024 RepID=A0A328BYJ7_9PAST|nr:MULTISPECIES: septal ring lytic transglycosylase RlpA family protein [Glaesserella]AUI66542.1 hypothetical protein CJD39_08110 [Glaesserella sp. 15-184]RAL18715.1 septal ring lytic transglycosylase RlpA family protein [Glaesserella australis]